MITFLDIDPTVCVGSDRKGVPLFDGDQVRAFNNFAPLETFEEWKQTGGKGVLATLRRRDDGSTWSVWTQSSDGVCGVRTSHPTYGVEFVSRPEKHPAIAEPPTPEAK